jgi:hypothetical protein
MVSAGRAAHLIIWKKANGGDDFAVVKNDSFSRD